jgi:hypothetical protein
MHCRQGKKGEFSLVNVVEFWIVTGNEGGDRVETLSQTIRGGGGLWEGGNQFSNFVVLTQNLEVYGQSSLL